MKPKATNIPMPKLSEEQKKEQIMRAYLQKKAAIAEGVLFNLMQNPNLDTICRGESPVKVADSMAAEFMKVVYKAEVETEEETEE